MFNTLIPIVKMTLQSESNDEVLAKIVALVPLKKEAFLIKMGFKPYKGKSQSKESKGWT